MKTPLTLILTNLPFVSAVPNQIQFCDCHHPDAGNPTPGSKFGMLDREDDWGAVTEPDETTDETRTKATAKRREEYRKWKDSLGIKSVGVYGLPIMLTNQKMSFRSQLLSEALQDAADWFAPTLYDERQDDPGIVLKRAEWARQCIDGASSFVRELPCLGCICPRWSVDGRSQNIPMARMAVQVLAAKYHLKASGLYVWDSLNWRVWQAGQVVSRDHPAYEHVQEARGILLNTYGFGSAAAAGWKKAAIEKVAAQHTANIINSIVQLWITL